MFGNKNSEIQYKIDTKVGFWIAWLKKKTQNDATLDQLSHVMKVETIYFQRKTLSAYRLNWCKIDVTNWSVLFRLGSKEGDSLFHLYGARTHAVPLSAFSLFGF